MKVGKLLAAGAIVWASSLALVVQAADDDRGASLDSKLARVLRQHDLHGPRRVDARGPARTAHRGRPGESRPPALVRQRPLASSRQHMRRLPFADERVRRYAVDCDWRRQQRARRPESHRPAQSAPFAARCEYRVLPEADVERPLLRQRRARQQARRSVQQHVRVHVPRAGIGVARLSSITFCRRRRSFRRPSWSRSRDSRARRHTDLSPRFEVFDNGKGLHGAARGWVGVPQSTNPRQGD